MSAQRKRIILTPIEEEAEQEELKISPVPFLLAGAAIVIGSVVTYNVLRVRASGDQEKSPA